MGAEDDRVRSTVLRRGAVPERELEPMRERIGREDVVAAAHERLREEQPGEPAADDEHAPARDPLDRAEDAGKGLGERPDDVVDPVGEGDRSGSAGALREAAGDDRRRREALARRLVAGAAAVALAARQVVDERDAVAFPVLGDDLVAEDGARSRAADLLDVRPTQAAGAHGHELAVPVGLGPVGERRLPRLVQHNRSHRGNRRGGTPLDCDPRGAIAQLGERLDRTQEVVGSSPTSSIACIEGLRVLSAPQGNRVVSGVVSEILHRENCLRSVCPSLYDLESPRYVGAVASRDAEGAERDRPERREEVGGSACDGRAPPTR